MANLNLDALKRYSKKIILKTLLSVFRLFPVKNNRVFLVNDLAYNYSDNPKSIAEYLLQEYNGFEIIFAVKDPTKYSDFDKKCILFVKFNSMSYFYYAMTSAVFLTNSGGFSYLPLRKKQYVINTWHGGGAYKKCGIDMYEDSLLFRKDLLLSANKTNVFLSTCRRFSDVISECMLIPRTVFWEIGMPRNDIMLRNDIEYRELLRKKIGLKEDEKLVLFAPTYRKANDNYFNESVAISYGVDCIRVCSALEKRFGGSWKFGFRFHPCVVNRNQLPEGNVMDLSDYPDMQELLCAADVMINDFSSSMWDFMLTGRPSFLFAVDLDHYIETTDVYTPVNEWPFPKSVNNDELEYNILTFDEKKYSEDCKRHYDSLGGCETGCATQKVCERIYEICFVRK